jgi:hypothetical protein
MSRRDQTAVVGLVAGVFGLAIVQSFVDKQAKTLGLSTAAIGVLVAALSRRL